MAKRSRPSPTALLALIALACREVDGAMLGSIDAAPLAFDLHHFGINMASAFAASSLATFALHPLDTYKTRLQATSAQPQPPPPHAGLHHRLGLPHLGRNREQHEQQHLDTAEKALASPLPAKPLFAGLYRGVGENVLKEAPDTAVFLAISEHLTHSLALSNPFFATHLTLTLCLSGAVGDAAGSIFRLPAEVLCKRLQTSSADGWAEALAGTNRESWMSAWAAILYRDVPMGGLQIATYREAHTFIASVGSGVVESLPDSFSDVGAGLLAGACAAALTTPLDVLVTHAAVAQPDETKGGKLPNAMEICKRLVEEEGPLALTKGLRWRSLYYAQNVAVFFGLYEYFRRMLETF